MIPVFLVYAAALALFVAFGVVALVCSGVVVGALFMACLVGVGSEAALRREFDKLRSRSRGDGTVREPTLRLDKDAVRN